MILREATPDDLRPLLRLAKKAWTRLGVPFDTDIDRFRKWADQVRIVVLYDAGRLAAALGGRPFDTEHGPGFEVVLFVVDPDAADKIKLLDAVSLYARNIAVSEGRYAVLSRSYNLTPTLYGRDTLRMDAVDARSRVEQTGDARTLAHRILERRPEWRL